ncbi:AraC family transcriptional regulator [Nocardia sp. CA2R105]|uniref:helix-turn-helix transcriptional regulator n=1 Tax=Nocardia coffeae TaxID=2873381 RepID=UPI001CA72788|nr:AraC family transcriptional regulator [Nocardia coffeae]MBY8862056.1 AraC family transcriptional regulator [Nocardia coffeae]
MVIVVTKGADPSVHYDVFEVSLDAGLPAVDRIDRWRDHVGRNQGEAVTRIGEPMNFWGRTWTQQALTTRNDDGDPNRIQLVEFASSAIDYNRSDKAARSGEDHSARLFIPLAGEIHLAQSDHAASIGPGQMGVLRWDRGIALSHGDDVRAYILHLPAYVLPPARDPQGALGIQPKNFILRNVRSMVDSLAGDRATLSSAEFVDFGRAIVDLIAGTLDERRAPELDNYARTVANARRRIHLYYSDSDLTVGTVAEHLGVSTRYLQGAMKKVAQHSLAEELRTIRLERARDLLQAESETRLDIVDVATACGYSSLSGFRDAFVAKYGIQPGEFRLRTSASDRQPGNAG